jgi:L-lysine exporter family protein LysE/ArgO
MTSFFTPFAVGFALSAALIMAIGAQNLFVFRQGLRREHVGAIVLFCACADAVLIVLGVSGVGALVGAAPQLASGMALGGAAFLAWYGIAALRRVANPDTVSIARAGRLSLGRALAATAGFTFLNPHVYLDTLLLMGAAGSAQPEALRPIFSIGAATASFAWFALVGYGAQTLQPIFTRPSAWRTLDALVGITMLALATSLVVRVFQPLG